MLKSYYIKSINGTDYYYNLKTGKLDRFVTVINNNRPIQALSLIIFAIVASIVI